MNKSEMLVFSGPPKIMSSSELKQEIIECTLARQVSWPKSHPTSEISWRSPWYGIDKGFLVTVPEDGTAEDMPPLEGEEADDASKMEEVDWVWTGLANQVLHANQHVACCAHGVVTSSVVCSVLVETWQNPGIPDHYQENTEKQTQVD